MQPGGNRKQLNVEEKLAAARSAAINLAHLMQQAELIDACGLIDPGKLRKFLSLYWKRVSLLAHEIHDNDQ